MYVKAEGAFADAGIEGFRIEVGVAFQVEGDPVGQAEIQAQAGTDAPEGLDGLPEGAEILRGGQFVRLLVLQAHGQAGADEAVHRDGTVRAPAEDGGAPVEGEVQVRLDELESIDGLRVQGGVLRIPAVHREPGAPVFIEAVADGDLGGRGNQLGEVARLGEVVGGAALQLDIGVRDEFLGRSAEGEGCEKSQGKCYFFHIGLLKDFPIWDKDNKKNRQMEKR